MSNPLPITFPDKQNSPELLAYLAQFGHALYVDANEINQIKAALNWLYNNVGGGTGVTNNTGFTPGEEEYVFNALFGWKLNGVDYAISEALTIPVPYAAAGMHRIDLIVANTTTLIRIPGPEVPVGDPAAEPIYNQLTQLRVTAIPVNEDGFGENTPVESINQFVKKQEYSETAIEGTGEITIDLTGESTAFRVLSSTIAKIKGFNASAEFMSQIFYIGKEIRLINYSGTDIILNHNDTSTAWPFRFPTGLNFVWKPRHVVIFRPTKTDAQYLEFQSDSVDSISVKDYSKEFPIHYKYQATSSSLVAIGADALGVTGTQSAVFYDGTLYRRTQSASTSGTTITVREGNWNRVYANRGFYFEQRFKVADSTPISDVRGFHGLASTATIGNVDPSTGMSGSNRIVMACDGADANWKLMYGISGAGSTIIDLGTDFPKSQTGDYLIEMWREKNSTIIFYSIHNFTNGKIAKGSVNFNPTSLTIYNFRNNNTSAAVCGFEVQRINLYVSD